MTKQEGDQIADVRRAVDRLLELSEARDGHIRDIAADVTDLKRQVTAMSPTVQTVAETLVFAKVGRRIVIGLASLGAGAMAILTWASGNLDAIKKVLLFR